MPLRSRISVRFCPSLPFEVDCIIKLFTCNLSPNIELELRNLFLLLMSLYHLVFIEKVEDRMRDPFFFGTQECYIAYSILAMIKFVNVWLKTSISNYCFRIYSAKCYHMKAV